MLKHFNIIAVQRRTITVWLKENVRCRRDGGIVDRDRVIKLLVHGNNVDMEPNGSVKRTADTS